MSKDLQISEDLRLPLDIITMRIAVYGDSGAGKTTFARLLAERIHEARHRFCAIDLKNDWYGLKSSADGESAGLPVVIFGGPRADVKLFDDAAAATSLAQTIATIDQSVIVDLDGMSRTKQEKVLAPFLDSLYESNRRPLLLFCDEADRYAPQKPMSQEALMSLSSSEDIARRGRKRGIGSFWLTQRTAVLNKNVSEFANLTVVFRTPGEKDLKELEDRVGRIAGKETVKEVMRLAPGLADGEAIFLSAHPKLRKYMPDPVRPIQLPLPSTFDSSATPSVGQRRREPKVLATTDLQAIEQKMAAQVERAKAEDPKSLRAELAKAKADLVKAQKPIPPPAPEQRIIEKPVVTDAQVKTVEKVAATLEREGNRRMKMAEELATSGRELVAQAKEFAAALSKAAGANVPPMRRPLVAVSRPMAARPAVRREQPVNGEAGEMGGGERVILIAVAQYPEGATREQISILTGYKRSTRDAYLQRLGNRGYVEAGGSTVVATEEGMSALGSDFEPLPTGEALQAYWLQKLPEGERKIFEVLIQQYPNAVPREALEESTGYKRSTRDAYIQRLNTRKIVECVGRGEVRASDVLFEAAAV